MKHNKLLGTLLVMALLAAACGAPAPSLPTEVEPLATSAVATVSPIVGEVLETASPIVGEALETASPIVGEVLATASPAEIPVTGGATIQTAVTETYGPILVNGEGLSLYVFMNDNPNSGTSACTDDCAAEWPALTTDGDPIAGSDVDGTLLGTITREDGSVQVTYNGRPLYLFDEDVNPGDTNGQDLEDEFGHWFLISPDGEPIQQ